jgi:hypothetical protein
MTTWESKKLGETELNAFRKWIVPNFGFTLHIQSGSQAKHKRAIYHLNRGFPSLAIRHDKDSEDEKGHLLGYCPHPHIHNLIRLPEERRDWFVETLFRRFLHINKDGLFRPLRERDIQDPIHDPAGMVAYAWDYKNYTTKNPQIIWGNCPKEPLVGNSGGRTVGKSAVLLHAQQTDTSKPRNEVPKRVPA